MVGLVALLGTGCTTVPQARPEGSVDFWSGRLALQVDTTPPQRWSAAFELQGGADQGALRLLSPLGATVASAEWTRAQVWLQQGDERRHFTDMEQLTQELLGAPLPIQTLVDWLRGRATEQAGWSVDWSLWAERRLSAQRNHPLPAARLTLRLD